MKLLLSLLLLYCTSALSQQPGTLDVQYGISHTGTAIIANKIYVQATALQKDDKLLLAGYDVTDYQFSLFRQNKNGSVDTGFGNKGQVLIDVKDLVKDFMFNSGWYALAVQQDGKIVAAGRTTHRNEAVQGEWGGPWDNDMVIARFLPDGELDTSFANRGRLVTDLGLIENVTSMTLQQDGKIIVAGYQDRDSDGDGTVALLVRYNSNGTLDDTFGEGTGYTRYTAQNSSIYDVAVQPDGKIVGGGGYYADSYFFVVRYLSNGMLDASFGNGGAAITDFHVPLLGTHISSLVLDKKGRITAVGATRYYEDGRVVRYLPNGKPDKRFMNNGRMLFNVPGFANMYVNTITTLPNNKFLIGSTAWNNGDTLRTPALTSMNEDGSLDTSFGTNKGYTLMQPGASVAQEVFNRVQTDGKIVTTYSQYTSHKALTTRYFGYSTEVPLRVRIKRWLQTHGISWNGLPDNDHIAYYSLEQSSNSKTGFKEIARIKAADNLKEYSISNSNLLHGTNYYRIKAVSNDGAIRYSEVVSVDNSTSIISVYPNPAKHYIVIQGLSADKTSNISIADGNGVVKLRSSSKGNIQQRLYIGNLQHGIYYMYITTGNNTTMTTFIKTE